jgi:DNA-binding Lrp family transcriptional regulator
MVIAYVFVKANTGDADRLKREITDIGDIDRVSIVAGDVDLVAKLAVETPADVKEIAADAIQGIGGVESTRTYVAME